MCVYAPKDDPYQRAQWGELYPVRELAQMRNLVAKAQAQGIAFVYSLSPGIPSPLPGQKLTDDQIKQSIMFTSSSDSTLPAQYSVGHP